MTKLQLLHRALNERMMAAVEQIMEMVGGTVQEYEEETMRVRKENEVLKRRLQWMEEANRAEWPGPNEPGRLYTQDELNASQQEPCAVSFEFGQESQGIVIKTESTDHSLYVSSVSGLATVPQSTDEGSAIAGTSASFNYGQRERMTWHSTQSYMEPLEFDPTPSSTVRCKTVRGKRQRMSFACPDCGKVFGREQGMLFHMRTHSTERPYAYRKRKACFYGDRIRKRKLHGLSRLSGEISDDRLDDSEQANVGSPLAEHPAQEQEPDNLSSNSDQANDDEGPPKTPSNPVQRKGDVTKKKLRCPLCRQKFKRRNDFDLHLKSHVEGRQAVLPGQEEQKKKGKRSTRGRKAKDAVQRTFPCLQCDKVFPRPLGLFCHMRSHGVPLKKLKSKPLQKKVPDQTERAEKETRQAVPEDNKLTKKNKKSYPCPHCDNVFSVQGWLKTHIQVEHSKIKKSSHFDVDPFISRTRSQKIVTKTFLVRKGMQGFGSYRCPSCNKAYSSMAWLSRHMSYHQKENPAALKQQSKTDDKESNEGNTNEKHSRENAPEESSEEKTMDIFETIKTSQTQSALQTDAISNVDMKHLSLQPKVVLKPLMPVCMSWSTVPSVDAHKSGSSESCSFNLVQTSPSASVNNKNVVESSGQSSQNKLEIFGHPQNDSQSGFINQKHFIVIDGELEQSATQTTATASLQLTDSELITPAENAPKEPGGTNCQCEDISAEELTFNKHMAVSESTNVFDLGLVFSQDEDDIDDVPNETVVLEDNHSSECLPNDSQSEVKKQMPVTVIEDEAEQSVTQASTIASMNLTGSELMTDAEKTLGESGETTEEISASKVTVEFCNEKLTTLVISDDEDGMNDAPSPSKGFDDIHSSVWHPNGPQILNSETESMNANDAPCSHIDNASQKAHVEDGPMSQEKSSETSQPTFGGEASLSQHLQVDKKLLDSKNDSGSHRPNTGSSVNTQKCSSLNSSFRSRWRKSLRDTSKSQERVRGCLKMSEKGPFPDVPLNRVSLEKRQELYRKSAERDGTPCPVRFALFLFKSLISPDIYQKWSGSVDFDGTKGKYSLPINLKKKIVEVTDRAFQHSVTPYDHKMIRHKINLHLRYKR